MKAFKKLLNPKKLPKIIVIIGPTGSGKSALAMHLAQMLNTEIISADSRAIYRGLDIGTAKPSKQDMLLVPHHLINILDVGDKYSVAKFQQSCETHIKEISSKDKIPIICGGTGLYINSIIYNYNFNSIKDKDDANYQFNLRPNTLILGVDVDRTTLRSRITSRVDQMIDSGLVQEATTQIDLGLDLSSYGPEYKFIPDFNNGLLSLEELKQKIITADMQYAKRQSTWIRNKIKPEHINWVTSQDLAAELAITFTTGSAHLAR